MSSNPSEIWRRVAVGAAERRMRRTNGLLGETRKRFAPPRRSLLMRDAEHEKGEFKWNRPEGRHQAQNCCRCQCREGTYSRTHQHIVKNPWPTSPHLATFRTTTRLLYPQGHSHLGNIQQAITSLQAGLFQLVMIWIRLRTLRKVVVSVARGQHMACTRLLFTLRPKKR